MQVINLTTVPWMGNIEREPIENLKSSLIILDEAKLRSLPLEQLNHLAKYLCVKVEFHGLAESKIWDGMNRLLKTDEGLGGRLAEGRAGIELLEILAGSAHESVRIKVAKNPLTTHPLTMASEHARIIIGLAQDDNIRVRVAAHHAQVASRPPKNIKDLVRGNLP